MSERTGTSARETAIGPITARSHPMNAGGGVLLRSAEVRSPSMHRLYARHGGMGTALTPSWRGPADS